MDCSDNLMDIEIYELPNIKRTFLRKGEGKLASHRHGETNFRLNRKNSFVFEQIQRENEHFKYNEKMNALIQKSFKKR